MKNLLLIIGLCLSLLGFSQVKVNPNVGLSFSKFSGEVSENFSISYVAGLDLRFGKRFNFIPGLYFGNVGTNVKVMEEAIEYEFDNSINTIQLRTLFGFNLINKKILRIRLNAGPSLHVLVNSVNIETENFNSMVAYLNGGLGFDFGLLTIDFKYENSITEIFDQSGPKHIKLNPKNNIIIMSIGLVF